VKDDNEGAWIFLSHSHNDIDEVRRVRDRLENNGHNPLMFFLKCLDDNSELDDLIRREIEARKFFLLCDSPNAQSSRWVQHEVELIKTMKGKVYRSIDLRSKWEEDQVPAIDDLSRRATVFLGYAHQDHRIGEQMEQKLRKLDYRVNDIPVRDDGDLWGAIREAIDTALAIGTVVFLMSPWSMENGWVGEEALYALQRVEAEADVDEPWRYIRFFIIRDPDAVYELLSTRPQWEPFRDFIWTDLSDIDHVSLADLSRMVDPR
jgi:hypothetical protein